MGKRVFSSTLLWAIVIATMWYGRNYGAIALAVLVSMLTVREFYVLMQASGYTPFAKIGTVFAGLITAVPVLETHLGVPGHLMLPFAVIVFSIRLLGERTPENRMESLCSTVFGLIYVALLLQYFVRLVLPLPGDAITPGGRLVFVLWLIAATKFCDMGGLLTGMAMGRHRMSPQISPKKTWEGAVGGTIASVAIGATIAWFGRSVLPSGMTPLIGALMALPVALLGIVGDLVESVIKRRANIKDSASIIPAMGGFFDMSDSLLLTGPLGFYFFTLLT